MHSREIEEQIKALDGKRRGAVAESIRHTVEATDALTRATLLVAYSQLRTAEAVEEISRLIAFGRVPLAPGGLTYTGASNASGIETGRDYGAVKKSFEDVSEELKQTRVQIPK